MKRRQFITLLGGAIAGNGFQAPFFAFGLVQGLVVMVLACFLFAPQPGQVPQSPTRLVPQGRHQYEPLQVVRAPVFWVMYVMFVLMAAVRPDGDPLTGPY